MLYMLFALVTPIVALPLGSGKAGLHRQESTTKRIGVIKIKARPQALDFFRCSLWNEKLNSTGATQYNQYLVTPGVAGLPSIVVRPLLSTSKLCGRQISVPRLPAGAGRVLDPKWMATSSLRYRETSSADPVPGMPLSPLRSRAILRARTVSRSAPMSESTR